MPGNQSISLWDIFLPPNLKVVNIRILKRVAGDADGKCPSEASTYTPSLICVEIVSFKFLHE